MIISNGDLWAAQFLRREPQCTEASWIDAHTQCIGRSKPELIAEQTVDAARDAFAREGDWNIPKVAAGCDAELGPLHLQ